MTLVCRGGCGIATGLAANASLDRGERKACVCSSEAEHEAVGGSTWQTVDRRYGDGYGRLIGEAGGVAMPPICVSDTIRGQGPSLLLACWAIARMIELDGQLSKGHPLSWSEEHFGGTVPKKVAKRKGNGSQGCAACVVAEGVQVACSTGNEPDRRDDHAAVLPVDRSDQARVRAWA